MKRPKIFILTASYGDGHVQVANALQEQFKRYEVDIRIINLMAEAHPHWDSFVKYIYLQSSKWAAVGIDYYGWSYYSTRKITRKHPLVTAGFSIGSGKLKHLLKEEQPDAVISTFPYFDVSQVCKNLGMDVQTFTIVTDFDLHQRWILSPNDRYYVATETLKEGIRSRGIAEEQIVVSGIPIRKIFSDMIRVDGTFAKYGLRSELKMTLVLSGGYGIRQSDDGWLQQLASIEGQQVVIVCGRNERRKQELEQVFAQAPNVHVLGYVDNVAALMSCADVLVTKAGGITLSEALVMNVPVFIARPQPGQELENARFLMREGGAVVVRRESELVREIEAVYQYPLKLQEMKQAMRRLAKPEAAALMVDDVVDQLIVTQATKTTEACRTYQYS
ncbi:glycosyltransferase [Paenibacillus sp. SC116]|uniref:MGDG synthase family glycosyltransferase n=1 Tax=Paenibacillus sp. SC116 TaxID=2968986 RepID=UPI00215AE95F|nr:glycosyltransferase [Paenibacillus sp. SC116]MCR8843722.1 glycosyltransferase [Paenibacillus sp. SC116]